MKKLNKFIWGLLISIILLCSCNLGNNGGNTGDDTSGDRGDVSISDVNALEIVKKMTIGWNLGNTLDAIARNDITSETSWGQPKTTKDMITGLAASGIKTIRIPVSWHNHIDNTDTYKINDTWMKRVKTIVDWAIDNDMYVILNIHHDDADSENFKPGEGFYPSSKGKEESEKYLKAVWTQISATFNNQYDEHLIFETLNEPRLKGTSNEWWYDSSSAKCKDAMNILNGYNQLIVDTIRSSGGNNQTRLIGIPSLQCAVDTALSNDFKLPKDSAENAIAVAVHMYTPYSFAMDKNGTSTFNKSGETELAGIFKRLNDKYVSKGIPVYVGEMGAINKDNLSEREKWFKFFISEARKYGIPAVMWDNGNSVVGDDSYGYYNRKNKNWYFPTIIKAALEAVDTEYKEVDVSRKENLNFNYIISENKIKIETNHPWNNGVQDMSVISNYQQMLNITSFFDQLPIAGDTIKISWKGKSNVDVSNLYIRLIDNSYAANYWKELSGDLGKLGDKNFLFASDIKKDVPFNCSLELTFEQAPLENVALCLWYDISDVENNSEFEKEAIISLVE